LGFALREPAVKPSAKYWSDGEKTSYILLLWGLLFGILARSVGILIPGAFGGTPEASSSL
jgi:hypothetical protein